MKPSITPFLSLRWRGNLFYTINEDTLQLVIQSPRSIVVCASSLSRKNKKISRTCVSTYSRPSFLFFLKACRVKLETRMRIFEHSRDFWYVSDSRSLYRLRWVGGGADKWNRSIVCHLPYWRGNSYKLEWTHLENQSPQLSHICNSLFGLLWWLVSLLGLRQIKSRCCCLFAATRAS